MHDTYSGRYDMSKINLAYRLSEAQQQELKDRGETLWRSRWRLTAAAYQERALVDMSVCRQIQSRVTIIHGTSDSLIPVQDAISFSRSIPCNDLRLLEGASHDFRDPAEQAALIQAVSESVRAALDRVRRTPDSTQHVPAL